MPDSLVIRFLPSAPDLAAEWLLVDGTGGRMGMVLSGALRDAAPLALNRRVIVLVPGTEALLANPTLPAKRAAQLEQLARYALEEQLASDIDDMHFALGKRGSTGVTPVVAIETTRIDAYLEELAAAGIQPDAMFVDADLTPSANGSVIVVDRGLLWIRHEQQQPAVLDVQPLSEALQLALPPTEADSIPATESILYISQADFDSAAGTLETVRERRPDLQVKMLPEGPLPLFALQAVTAADRAVNLLFGRYARKKSWNKTFAPWRLAAMLGGVAIALYIATSGARLWQLARTERQLDAQLLEVLSQGLPTANKDPRTAKRQFEAVLGTQRGGSAGGFLRGLEVLGSTVEQVPDTRIDALAYRTRIIDLRLTAPNVDALDRIQHIVAEQGIPAEIQSATPRDTKVEGRMQLKAPEA